MVEAGYCDSTVKGILGENYLRLAELVWR